MEAFDEMPLAKRVFYTYVVSKDNVTQDDFEELRKVSSRAFQYGKANTNARYREHVLEKNGSLCCDYCGKPNLAHNPLKTRGTLEEYVTENKKFFYHGKKYPNPATVDHINPISLGADVIDFDNLTISCELCNSVKASMTFDVWVDFMSERKKTYNHFFEVNHSLEKFQKALAFEPNVEYKTSFDGEVVMNREDLSSYIKYKLGSLYDAKWQRILSSNICTKPYYGSNSKPNLETNLWIHPNGEIFDLNSLKPSKIKKCLDIIKNKTTRNLFYEVHCLELTENETNLWIQKMEYLIQSKTTRKKIK